MRKVHIYEKLWKKLLPHIIIMLKKADKEPQELILDEKIFIEAEGERESSGYGFNLKLHNAELKNNKDGNAVARDLNRVLLNDHEAKEILQKCEISMRAKYYVLTIQKN